MRRCTAYGWGQVFDAELQFWHRRGARLDEGTESGQISGPSAVRAAQGTSFSALAALSYGLIRA